MQKFLIQAVMTAAIVLAVIFIARRVPGLSNVVDQALNG